MAGAKKRIERQCVPRPDESLDLPFILTEEELQIERDHDWALSEPKVQRGHGGQVIAVYKGIVLGWGKDDVEALDTARMNPNCPANPEELVVTVFIPKA